MANLRRITRAVASRLGLVLLSTFLTLAAAELVFRLWIIDPEIDAFFTPFVHDDSSYRQNRVDKTLLYTLAWYVPGATGVTGSAPVRINNLGLRDDHDYPKKKPAGCYRILVLGDSMTFGKGVAESQTFPGRLETRLQARYPDRCIEVLNAGQPNTNFHIQWAHYQISWHTFQPDLVLVGFFIYNDSQLEGEEEPYSMWWMEFVDAHPWLKRSALVRWAYHRAFFDLGGRALKDGMKRFFDPEYAGWQQFRDDVKNFQRMAQGLGQRTAFALIPVPVGYDNYPYRAQHEQITNFLTREVQIPVFDLLEAVRGIKARKHWVHPSDGHPDAFVHDQMALYLQEVMPWTKWLDDTRSPDPSKP